MSALVKMEFPKNSIVCKQDESDKDLYVVQNGELLVCIIKESRVTPLTYLKGGDFFGELSFFDDQPRSAFVIATKNSTVIKISQNSIPIFFPGWLYFSAKSLTKKLRMLDEVVNKHGLKKKTTSSMVPLTIDEQRFYYNLIQES